MLGDCPTGGPNWRALPSPPCPHVRSAGAARSDPTHSCLLPALKLQPPAASGLPLGRPPGPTASSHAPGDHVNHSTRESSRLRSREASASPVSRTLWESRSRGAARCSHTTGPTSGYDARRPGTFCNRPLHGTRLTHAPCRSPEMFCPTRRPRQRQDSPRSSPSALGRCAPWTLWPWTEAPAAARSYSATCTREKGQT